MKLGIISEEDITLQKLSAPFPASDIEWRVGQAGEKRSGGVWAKVLAYVTNRAIMQRLDDTVGPTRWKNEFRSAPEGEGVLCGVSIFVNDQLGWVTKWDGASNTDIEAIKGGLSNAMKRAAVQWGIGRYLYDLESGWADILPDGEKGYGKNKTKDGTWFDWNPPDLPSWALPGAEKGAQPKPPAQGVKHEVVTKRVLKQVESAQDKPEGPANRVVKEGEQPKAVTPVETLDIIKRAGELSDEVEVTIRREKFPLKQFVKDNWNELKENPALATVVAKTVEKALGKTHAS